MKRFAAVLFLSFAAVWARAVPAEPVALSYYLSPEGADYDPEVPEPAEVIGFQPGEWHLRHDQIVRYLETLAEGSERMRLFEYARSHEGKPFYLLAVSSPENLARLEAIQRHQQAEAGLIEAETELANPPVVLWLGYSIHGNEPSGANAVPLVAYHLAAARNEEISDWLENMVVFIDPVLNPDGLDRFAHWANTHRGIRMLSGDPNDREHREVWPGGRRNHYWFDLNRDWLPLVHPGTRARVEQFHFWRPHIVGDFHEMQTSRTFFFQPGVPSRNNPMTPELNYEITAEIAKYNAADLDEIGSLYYTKETFDDFYVGKGSTYPDLNGSIGILFEQASSRGHLQESPHGPVSFPFTIRNQLTASLGTMRGAFAMREELLAYPRRFREANAEAVERAENRAYVFAESADPVLTFEFLDLLQRHRIAVYRLARDLELDGKRFAAGEALIVPVEQAQSMLVRSLFERQTTFVQNVFYDISTWVLPSSFNMEAEAVPAASFSADLLGLEPVKAVRPKGELIGGRSEYAYAISWESWEAPVAVQRFLSAGILVKGMARPFAVEVDGERVEFGAGTVVVPVGLQREKSEEIFALASQAAKEHAVRIYALRTGLALEGIDLGSPSAEVLENPKVLIAVGDGVDSGVAGEVWHLLDQRLRLGSSLVEVPRLNSIDLSRYNVIVLPDGSYSSINDSGVASLRRWLDGGGTIIAIQRASSWLVREKLAGREMATRKSNSDGERERLPYADGADLARLQSISGAIVTAQVDRTHPLGFGVSGDRMHFFREGTIFMQLSNNPFQTPAAYEAEPLFSGYVSEENLEVMAGTAAVAVSHSGSGRSIMFMDNPVFRGYWFGSARMFINGIYHRQLISRISYSGEEEVE